MVATIWIAEKNIDYEGSEFLGVFSTPEKAFNACRKESKKHKDTELVFDELDVNYYKAKTGLPYIHYYVFHTEIDAEDVDNEGQ